MIHMCESLESGMILKAQTCPRRSPICSTVGHGEVPTSRFDLICVHFLISTSFITMRITHRGFLPRCNVPCHRNHLPCPDLSLSKKYLLAKPIYPQCIHFCYSNPQKTLQHMLYMIHAIQLFSRVPFRY